MWLGWPVWNWEIAGVIVGIIVLAHVASWTSKRLLKA
jgi:hypothetical protein